MSTVDSSKALNPFVGERPAAHETALAHTDGQRAIAEVQAAMMIAKANPRDPVAAVDRILNACTRRTLAEAAVYQYSRGGSGVSGPSIRLAEAIAQQWGNLQFGVRELESRNGASLVQAFAWDVESNTRREVTFTVPHERHTKRGVTRLDDPRDIYELVANQGSRRLRACILAVIPGDVVEAAVHQCEITLSANADTSPEGVRKMVDAFQALGVSARQIEARIQRRLDSIQPAQIVALKKIYASLRDGMSGVGDWFEPEGGVEPAGAPASASRADVVRARARAQTPSPAKDGLTYAQVRERMESAQGLDALDEAASLIDTVPEHLCDELRDIYRALRERMS